MRRTIALGSQSARVSVSDSVALVGHTRERRAKSGCIHVRICISKISGNVGMYIFYDRVYEYPHVSEAHGKRYLGEPAQLLTIPKGKASSVHG